jgi:putative transposase
VKQLRTYRYKLKPSREQSLVLGQWLGACRYVYNLCLDYRKTLWQSYRLNLKKNEVQQELAVLVKEISWLACLHSQTLQEVTDRLWLAYDGFFKSGKGFPKFARRDRYHSFAFKQGVRLHPHTNAVQLPKLGKIKYLRSRLLPADATIKRASVSQQADGWYVSLCVETDIAPLPLALHASVGIDVGIKALATLSTGEAIVNPRFAAGTASVGASAAGGKPQEERRQKPLESNK